MVLLIWKRSVKLQSKLQESKETRHMKLIISVTKQSLTVDYLFRIHLHDFLVVKFTQQSTKIGT